MPKQRPGSARALAASGEYGQALADAADAEHVSRNHLRLMLERLPERQSLQYALSRPKGLDLVLSIAAIEPRAATTALDEAIRSRALVLDEMAARRGARPTGDPGLWSAVVSARQRLAHLLVRGPGDLPVARYTALVDDARRDSETAESKLAEQSTQFREELSRARIGLGEVAAAIPPDAALVSFVRYARSVWTRPSQGGGAAAAPAVREVPSYIAFVVRPDRPPVALPLGTAASADALVAAWRQDIASRGMSSVDSVPSARSSRVSGARVRRALWDPLVPHLDGVVRVFIVPDGMLSLAPFAALPVGCALVSARVGAAPPLSLGRARSRDVECANPDRPRVACDRLPLVQRTSWRRRIEGRIHVTARRRYAGDAARHTGMRRSAGSDVPATHRDVARSAGTLRTVERARRNRRGRRCGTHAGWQERDRERVQARRAALSRPAPRDARVLHGR